MTLGLSLRKHQQPLFRLMWYDQVYSQVLAMGAIPSLWLNYPIVFGLVR